MRSKWIPVVACTAILLASASASAGGTASAPFEVKMTLRPAVSIAQTSAAPQKCFTCQDVAAFCGVGTGGQVVKVSCKQGSYTMMVYLIQNQLVVDGHQSTEFGATTGYRVISSTDRDYIEMTVGW